MSCPVRIFDKYFFLDKYYFQSIFSETSGRTAIHRSIEIIREPDQAAAVLHPRRRRLLSALESPLGAASLARKLGIPRQKLRYHLTQLESLGLLESAGTRQARGCQEKLLRRCSRKLLLHPFLLELGKERRSPSLNPRSWSYLRSRVVKLLRELELASDQAEARPLAVEAKVKFPSTEHRETFENELRESFQKLAAKHGGSGLTHRYHLLGWPEKSKED